MELFFVYMLAVLCCFSCCTGAPIAPSANSTAVANVQVGFYSRTCPQAEEIVRAQVQKRFLVDKTITPALLRMLFHDSFVRGADASILLDAKPGQEAEKEALPNLTIRGFDLINEVKEALEATCPGVVSCADIIVMAVRDSVALAGGPKYEVPTGRLDGKVSLKEEALNLPSPAFPVEQSQESFRQKGLDLEDMVALLGAHTVGVALCGFFNDRLFNFRGTGSADPTMNRELVMRLSGVCPNPFFTESNADPAIDLDQSTVSVFDSAYYSQIIAGNGILQIDQEITADPSTAGLVQSFTSTTAFFPAFVRSIIKMGNIEVKTGANPLGEVRRKCNVTNSGVATRTPAPPAPRGNVSKPAPVTKPAPAGHVGKPPHTPISKPPPGGHITKPPTTPMTKPAPIKKPAPPGHVSKPSPVAPITKPPVPGHVSKQPPVTPITKPAPSGHSNKLPVTKPAPPGHGRSRSPRTPRVKPAPAGHVSKPAPVTPVTKPPAPGHGSKPPPTSPVTKPAPAGHISKSPVMKPAPPGHVRRPPVTPLAPRAPVTPVTKAPASGHGSKPRVSPVTKPAPSGHVRKSPVRKPAPTAQGSRSPPAPAGRVNKPALIPAPAKRIPARHGRKPPVAAKPAPPTPRHVRKSPVAARPPPISPVSSPLPFTPVAKRPKRAPSGHVSLPAHASAPRAQASTAPGAGSHVSKPRSPV